VPVTSVIYDASWKWVDVSMVTVAESEIAYTLLSTYFVQEINLLHND